MLIRLEPRARGPRPCGGLQESPVSTFCLWVYSQAPGKAVFCTHSNP